MAAAVLFISLAIFIFLNIPISISLGLSSALTLIVTGSPLGVIPSMMQATVQKFSLLTIPLFVLAGVLMDKGGISKRLINLADSMMGLGIDMIHLGVVLVLNLSIGQVTPPVGPNLYVAADIGKVKFEEICRKMVPLLLMSMAALLIITFVPWLTTCLIK